MKNHRNSHAPTEAPAPQPTDMQPPQPLQLPMPDPMLVIGQLTMKNATMESALTLAVNELNKWGSLNMDFEQVKAILDQATASAANESE